MRLIADFRRSNSLSLVYGKSITDQVTTGNVEAEHPLRRNGALVQTSGSRPLPILPSIPSPWFILPLYEARMPPVRYHLRDLTFAKKTAARAHDRLSRQEMIGKRSRNIGKSVYLDNELLMRLYDRNRRIIERVKRIEAALDAKS
ncbi:hypothetical protein PYR71_07715 [Rhizobium sp. MC63]|uniref:Uncharacterized protein n=2 Tax=Rhizobium TaxID=379 RepID=A0A7W8XKP0_9HYPH|nr:MULTISPECIES: hypothetical protein [Rhizobium]MBB4577474.1 hypothetical protein [Rhizobium lentis]MBB5554103.1 hypothetical protein [Rhizobium lentis]MBB5564650.1 hypothetical protein [Rhizobium lentis]MBB5571166.1 hypothetical protein [Rhizobium lentis]MDF0696402.1 hypothetical protein [Rhizobium sp. MC63]